jgi:hypothetical protein
MRDKITIDYVLDNDNWSDEDFNKAQDVDRQFIITKDMIEDLICQNCNLEKGDYISSIFIKSF